METPKKINSASTKPPRRPRKRKRETLGEKSLEFYNKLIQREEDGVLKDYYACKLCGKERCGTNPANLATHLLNKHRDIYERHIGSVKESIPVKRLKLLHNCVSIIALGGRPFTALSDFGFQAIISKQINKIQKAGLSLDLKSSNQPDVHHQMHQTAQKVRDTIKNEVENRPLSILLDIGTRQKRSILGISVQFIVDSAVHIRSIGMIEITKRHTAKNLAEFVKDCLKKYEIKKRQIMSITTDNGRNVLKLVRDLRNFLNDELLNRPNVAVELNFGSSQSNDNHQPDANIDRDIATVLTLPEITDEEALDLIFGEDEIDPDYPEHEALISVCVDELMHDNDFENVFNITGVNCAAHTVQLAIQDALNCLTESTRNVISLSRRVAKILRLKSTRCDLASANIQSKMPHLDVNTRWGSMYTMLCDLFTSLDAIKYFENSREFTEFGLLLQKWSILKDLVRILAIPYKATIEMQRHDLTLPDAYGSWLKMELHLENKGKRATKTGLEKLLVKALRERKQRHAIFDNPLMKAALYLDPRFRRQITRDHESTDTAKETLLTVSRRLIALSEITRTDTSNPSTEERVSSDDDSFDAQKAFDEYFNRTTAIESNYHSDFEASLDIFDPPVMPISASVLEYWHKSYDEHSKLLFDVAMAILAIPPTEVAIERDFSTLRFILNDLRTNLSPKTLENILTINLNKSLYLQINEMEISKLEKSHPALRDNVNVDEI